MKGKKKEEKCELLKQSKGYISERATLESMKYLTE